jgi:hypothetical protein
MRRRTARRVTPRRMPLRPTPPRPSTLRPPAPRGISGPRWSPRLRAHGAPRHAGRSPGGELQGAGSTAHECKGACNSNRGGQRRRCGRSAEVQSDRKPILVARPAAGRPGEATAPTRAGRARATAGLRQVGCSRHRCAARGDNPTPADAVTWPSAGGVGAGGVGAAWSATAPKPPGDERWGGGLKKEWAAADAGDPKPRWGGDGACGGRLAPLLLLCILLWVVQPSHGVAPTCTQARGRAWTCSPSPAQRRSRRRSPGRGGPRVRWIWMECVCV